ncbi:MAG TPA: class I SAM-dependent methyltransferase [Planktothrix sp.]|jgi:predicted O-methyltransferase YrrM
MNTASEKQTRLRSVIERVVTEGKAVAQSDKSEHEIFPVAVSAAEGQSLRDWVKKEKVTRTIEIGLAYGISALFICEGLLSNGLEDVLHVATDPFQAGFKNCGLQLLEEAGVRDLIEYYAEESQILLPKFLSENRAFEFAFVDGSHLFERVFLDLIYLGRLVLPGRIIFVDDYQLPAIARAVSFCMKNLGWTLEELSPSDENHQWAVLRTPSEPIKRSFRDYVEF